MRTSTSGSERICDSFVFQHNKYGMKEFAAIISGDYNPYMNLTVRLKMSESAASSLLVTEGLPRMFRRLGVLATGVIGLPWEYVAIALSALAKSAFADASFEPDAGSFTRNSALVMITLAREHSDLCRCLRLQPRQFSHRNHACSLSIVPFPIRECERSSLA